MSLGLQFIQALLTSGNPSPLRDVREDFFVRTEREAFLFVKQHLARHGALPDADTLHEHGLRLSRSVEPPSYYSGKLRERYVYNLISSRNDSLVRAMTAKDTSAALGIIRELAALGGHILEPESFSTLQLEATELIADYLRIKESGLPELGIPFGWPTLDEMTLGMQGGDLVVLAGRPNVGKAQPLDERIPTPTGWTTMGELSVGKEVFSKDGTATEVTAIHPQGVLPVYSVVFSDGVTVRCCADHLWEVKSARWRGSKVLPLSEVMRLDSTVRHHGRLSVPMAEAAVFPEVAHVIHPYVMGVLLAEGALTGGEIRWTCEDAEVHELMSRFAPEGYEMRPYNSSGIEYCYRMTTRTKPNPLRLELERLSVMWKGALVKAIPSEYIRDSYENRLWLIRGMMDGDGSVEGFGTPSISLSSKQLASDLREVLHSIGAAVTFAPRETQGAVSYRMSIRHGSSAEFFTLKRKSALVCSAKNLKLRRTIKAIIPEGEVPCQCITVAHPSALYLAEGYVVTHNSWIMLFIAYMAWSNGASVGILSMEMTKKQIVRRFVSLITRANPNLIRQGTLSTWAEELMRGTVRGLRRRPPVYVNSTDMKHKSTLLVEKLFGDHCPDIVLVDSAYRLQPQDARGNMSGWERQSQMVGELKQFAIHYDRPVVAVNQYNRSVKSKGGKAELGSAAGTDSWEQDSSMFLGIRFGPAPFEESSRILDLTKDREGPLGSFRINFGFDPVDFSEIAGDEQYEMTEGSEWGE